MPLRMYQSLKRSEYDQGARGFESKDKDFVIVACNASPFYNCSTLPKQTKNDNKNDDKCKCIR